MSNWKIEVVTQEKQETYQQAFVLAQRNYRYFYGAELSTPASEYFVLYTTNEDNQSLVRASMSVTRAEQQPLFSEQYLEKPVESYLPQNASRKSVMEIGSLASQGDEYYTHALITHSPFISLYQYEWEYALTTITPVVEHLLKQNGLIFKQLAEARAEALPAEERAKWGSYYEQHPKVCLIDVKATLINHLEQRLNYPRALIELQGQRV